MRVMRLVWVLGLILLCAPVFAQELDINGYSKVVIPNAAGGLVNATSALRETAREAGFEVHRDADAIPTEARSTALYMTAGLAARPQPVFFILVYDLATQIPVAYCTRRASAGQPGSVGPSVARAMEDLIEDMGYQGFEHSAYAANLRVFDLARTATEQSTPSTASASPNRPQLSCGAAAPTVETEEQPSRRSRRRSQD
jgi:hypothetical protein